MSADIVFIQFCLGIVLFFLINWIGKHSYSIGYVQISIFVKTEEAPALNFLIRILTPVVFLIVISTILYNWGLDKYVLNIYLVNVYYVFFRLMFNLFTNRTLLLNWYRQFLYWIAIITISYYTYDKLIEEKANILPDFTSIANELWIIILIFLFQIANNMRFSNAGTIKRKNAYLVERYNHFKVLYGKTIEEITGNDILEAITYSIVIYEDFNRPKVIRGIENISQFFSKKPHTLGVMQVRTDRVITDYESVKMGTEKIMTAYEKHIKQLKEHEEDFSEYGAIYSIIGNYNNGSEYLNEVYELFAIIKDKYYASTNDSLKTPL